MIAKLWADQIEIGTKKFSQVPPKLKEQVKTILIERGKEGLTKE